MKWIDPVAEFFSWGGGGLFCQVTVHDMFNDVWNTIWQSYAMSHDMGGGGGFSAKSLFMACSMMHEIQFGKVMSCHMIQAK